MGWGPAGRSWRGRGHGRRQLPSGGSGGGACTGCNSAALECSMQQAAATEF